MYAIKYYLEKYKIHIIVFTIILITLLTYLLYFNFNKRNKNEEVIKIDNKESVELLSIDTSIEDAEIDEIENTDIKISYTGSLYKDSYEGDIFLHYGFGPSWENVNEIKMIKTELGYQAEITLPEKESFNSTRYQ